MAFLNLMLLLKLKYSRNRTTLKSPNLLPTKVTIASEMDDDEDVCVDRKISLDLGLGLGPELGL